MRIWKFPLRVACQTVHMPRGAKILSVQNQGGFLQLWALCDEAQPLEPRGIDIYGTGQPLPSKPGRFIATVQTAHGELVWHVFEDTAGI